MTDSDKNTLAIQALGFDPQKNRGIALLEAIATHGSINSAAQKLRMSYKAAWEQVEKLNNLADSPLLKRSVGGRGGGGTELTTAGFQLIRHYRRIEREYRRFLQFINEDMENAAAMSRILRRMEMKVSARNIWIGQVKNISDGAVNAVVEILLRGGDLIVAVVTRESVESLALVEGAEVMALVKSSSVVLAQELRPDQVSARNVLCGQVSRLVTGPVTHEVTIDLPGGNTVTATVTKESAIRLGLETGSKTCALIKASGVLLAVN